MRKAGSDFVDGEMDGDTCVLTEKGPPGGGPPGGGGDGPPGGDDGPPGGGAPGGGRRKRQVDLPSINVDTFDVDWISFFAVQDKPVLQYILNYKKLTIHRVTQSWMRNSMGTMSTHSGKSSFKKSTTTKHSAPKRGPIVECATPSIPRLVSQNQN